MKKALIDRLHFPYCLSAFSMSRVVDGVAHEIRYGLIRCGCFEFPIVHGVLLLGLVKGYGGAEEAIQPYVPLQVAAVLFLRDGNLDGFADWMRKKAPLIHELCDDNSELDYL